MQREIGGKSKKSSPISPKRDHFVEAQLGFAKNIDHGMKVLRRYQKSQSNRLAIPRRSYEDSTEDLKLGVTAEELKLSLPKISKSRLI